MPTFKWQQVFPDFLPECMPAIPETWRDVSWENDSCPCFSAPAAGGMSIFVYVGFPEDGAQTFTVHNWIDDTDLFEHNFDVWDDVIKHVEELKRAGTD